MLSGLTQPQKFSVLMHQYALLQVLFQRCSCPLPVFGRSPHLDNLTDSGSYGWQAQGLQEPLRGAPGNFKDSSRRVVVSTGEDR